MCCKICGSENGVSWRSRSSQFLCDYCHKDTPMKIGYSEFCRRYFGDEDVPHPTKKSFYEDYQASANTFDEYVKSTTSAVL